MVKEMGIPICDFKLFSQENSVSGRFKKAVERAKVLNILHKKQRMHFVEIVNLAKNRAQHKKLSQKQQQKHKMKTI